MESGGGNQPFGPGSPGYGPGGDDDPSDAPGGPQSPAPGPQGPQPQTPPPPPPPAPGPQAPQGPQGPESPIPATGTASTYGGPVPPGGWQQPTATAPTPPPPIGKLAGWGSRAGAYVIDALILLVPGAILFFTIVAGAVGISGDDEFAIGAAIGSFVLFFILFAIISLLYAPLLMQRKGAHNGQTWGKQVVGIRVVRDSGEPMTFGPAAIREVLLKSLAVGIASSIIPILPWFLNFFWPLWDDQNRAIHDLVASTHVVDA